MSGELRASVAMALLLAVAQLTALALATPFLEQQFQAFENPSDPVNAVVYILIILAFSAAILGMVRVKKTNWIRYVILGSMFLTMAFVYLLPMWMGLFFLPPESDLRANVASVLAIGLALVLTYALYKYPEWYLVDAAGISVAAGVIAIMGISFAILPALLLLIGLAIYDALAVYRTKHMVTLADAVASQRLPVLLVIPKKLHYSFLKQPSLKEQMSAGDERDAMFMGLGDVIVPGILVVSAFSSLASNGPQPFSAAPLVVALSTLLGVLIGFALLIRYVSTGNPQAGLPLLNGGAIVGYVVSYILVYGDLGLGIGGW